MFDQRQCPNCGSDLLQGQNHADGCEHAEEHKHTHTCATGEGATVTVREVRMEDICFTNSLLTAFVYHLMHHGMKPEKIEAIIKDLEETVTKGYAGWALTDPNFIEKTVDFVPRLSVVIPKKETPEPTTEPEGSNDPDHNDRDEN